MFLNYFRFLHQLRVCGGITALNTTGRRDLYVLPPGVFRRSHFFRRQIPEAASTAETGVDAAPGILYILRQAKTGPLIVSEPSGQSTRLSCRTVAWLSCRVHPVRLAENQLQRKLYFVQYVRDGVFSSCFSEAFPPI